MVSKKEHKNITCDDVTLNNIKCVYRIPLRFNQRIIKHIITSTSHYICPDMDLDNLWM